MRFYNREEELKELKRIQQLAFEESSRMTVVTVRCVESCIRYWNKFRKLRISVGTKICRACAISGMNSSHKVASFLRPINK